MAEPSQQQPEAAAPLPPPQWQAPSGFVWEGQPPQGFIWEDGSRSALDPTKDELQVDGPQVQQGEEVQGPPEAQGPPQVPEGMERLPVDQTEVMPGRPKEPGREGTRDLGRRAAENARRVEAEMVEKRRIVEENRRRRIAEIRYKLGDDILDETGALTGSVDNLLLRMDFARSDKFIELRRKYLEANPKGDLRTMPLSDGESVLLFREDQSQPWKPVDPQAFDMIAGLADILPSIFSEETAVTGLLTAATGGSGNVVRVLMPMIGEALGVFARSGVESKRGFEESSFDELEDQAAQQAAISGVMAKLFSFRKTIGSNYREAEDLADAAEFAVRKGIESPVIGQTARNSIVRAVFQQTVGTTARAQDIVNRQKVTMLDALEREGRAADKFEEGTAVAIRDERLKEAKKIVAGIITGKTKLDFGEAMDAIVNNYFNRERKRIGTLYDGAYQRGQNVVIDLSEAVKVAKAETRGTFGAGSAADPETGLPVPVQVTDEISGKFAAAVKALNDLDPTVKPFDHLGKTDSPFEIVKDLRSRFYILSLPDLGRARRDEVQEAARRIHSELTKALDNPVGGDADFKALHENARKANREFENVTEMGILKSVLREANNPASDLAVTAAQSIARPGRPNALATIKNIATPEEWENFRQGHISSLLSDPSAIERRLDGFVNANEMSSLRSLVTPQEEAALREYARAFDRISSSPLQKGLADFGESAERAAKYLAAASRADIADAVKNAGGKGGAFAQSLKGAVYKDIIKRASEIQAETGNRIIDPRKALKAFSDYEKEGKIFAFMTPSEIANFKNFGTVASVFGGRQDVGGQMRRGAIAGAAHEFLNPIKMAGAAHRMLSDDFTARVLLTPAGQRFLALGPQIEPGTARAIRIGAVLMGAVAQDIERANSAVDE